MVREGLQRPAIEVANLTKTFTARDGSAVAALGPVSMAIGEHEFVSVVGPSGCGKSTLLKIVAGLTPKSGGSAAVMGTGVSGPRGNVGLVFQSPLLLPWKTIEQNVLLPIQIKTRRRPGPEAVARARELLALVGLGDFIARYPYELSGGMQQRASIVRALIGEPDILLMDEPFGALDAITRDQLHLELLSIWSRTRKTVLFITHAIAEAVFLSDRVFVFGLRPGQIIEEFRIGLPRPRSVQQIALPEFGRLVADIRLALERGIKASPAAAATAGAAQ